MTPEEEQHAAQLFAEGKSEREVAAELDISPSSAHRLRKRLEDRQETAPEITEVRPDDRTDGPVMLMNKPDEAAELAALAAQREELAGQLENIVGRAQSSASALQALERERHEVLAQGGDAVQLRQRMRDAQADLDDWATSAKLLQQRVEAIDARVAEIGARRELEAQRAELAAAVAERDAVFARSGDRLRAAVAAVRAAAEDFCAVFAEEEATTGRVGTLAHAVATRARELGEPGPAVPGPAATGIGGPIDTYGGPGLALSRALTQARRGDIAAVATHLGEVNGWLPPGPPTEEELEQRRRIFEERQRQEAELRKRAADGPRADEREAPVPVGLDHFGNPVDRFGNVLVPRGSVPHPLDVYRQGYANTLGGSYAPGYQVGY